MRTPWLSLVVATLLTAGHASDSGAVSIAFTKHNLSISGPGPVRAVTETQICVFCHTPHGAVTAPLWNRTLSPASYTVPSSAMAQWATMKSRPQNPPDGDSRLCLSCHDGTVAIGAVVNLGGTMTTISMHGGGILAGSGELSSASTSYMGTDLSGHHPVSIEVNDSLIRDKGLQCDQAAVSFRVCRPLPPVKLRPTENFYGAGPHTRLGVQCTSCHDAHDDPLPGVSKFLRIGTPDDTTSLCAQCHFTCPTTCN